MGARFRACELPWRIWPWGLDLSHSDTDVVPECSVEFGAMIVRPSPSDEEIWVRVDFELAAFASAKPHRDDERLEAVTGYEIDVGVEYSRMREVWLGSGRCPDPKIYFSTSSAWLDACRGSWARRQRTSRSGSEAVHFLLDGRDGYLEILAAGFSWRAWSPGQPLLSDVTGEPRMSGEWTPGASTDD